jgi:hypothetical protein
MTRLLGLPPEPLAGQICPAAFSYPTKRFHRSTASRHFRAASPGNQVGPNMPAEGPSRGRSRGPGQRQCSVASCSMTGLNSAGSQICRLLHLGGTLNRCPPRGRPRHHRQRSPPGDTQPPWSEPAAPGLNGRAYLSAGERSVDAFPSLRRPHPGEKRLFLSQQRVE